LRLDRLVEIFGLNEFDRQTLLICLAPALDPRYERIYGYLQDDVTRRQPSLNLIFNLVCVPGTGRRVPGTGRRDPGSDRLAQLARFTAGSRLQEQRLVERLPDPARPAGNPLAHSLALDETLTAWLLGQDRLHPNLAGRASLTRPVDDPADELLAQAFWAELPSPLPAQSKLAFWGPDRASQEAAARRLSVHYDRPLLRLDLEPRLEDPQDAEELLILACRDARLHQALLLVQNWQACLADSAPPNSYLKMVDTHPLPIILSGSASWLPGGSREQRLLWFEFPIPDYNQRLAIWLHALQECGEQDSSLVDIDLQQLAGQFLLTGGQIFDAVSSGLDAAQQSGRPLEARDLFSAARTHSNPRLSSLAIKIQPRFDWQDIILPRDQRELLNEMINTVRTRSQVLETWGLGRKLVASQGVTALFAGPPGTGKTMAAEVIARELRLDLYKIDLSSVVSKYIGETEKNLERIFDEAAASNAILFFDEADALFGKRSEVRDSHDRYANIEISYLLQRMEAYDGVTILATNLRSNLDEAFTRRLQFAVDFPFPDENDRLRIWQALFPPGVPTAGELDLPLLARRFKLAGGNIRNILVSAAYLAAADGGQVRMTHLLHGTRRELQKMGRLIADDDLTGNYG
jgi:ATP-dependent 26S proteasome regulatory subunit